MASPSSPPPSSFDSGSGSDSSTAALRHVDLTPSVLQSYTSLSREGREISPDLAKIQSFLLSSSSGALSCLICLERIRPADPTWSCSASCSAVFHLLCIQSWARAASSLSAARAASRGAQLSFWNCPKCRFEYSQTFIPKKYLCFCGKTEDPVPDPWVLPHSCGEVCNRPLRDNCGHFCLLLCHPGPCPSCPELVKTRCFCGAQEDVQRCGLKDFSCNGACSKLLDCKTHRCQETCHEGECPPCQARVIYKCQCGNTEEERECSDRIFQCGVPCEKQLPCGKHSCNKGCHAGDCGECPFQGKQSCPCGKRVHEGMACDVEVPLCGATCEKLLNCGDHRCLERCHHGPCIETCRNVVHKSCRCGSLKKEVPCHQDLACERKCQRVRDCERHACKRRCCDGDCPPCPEICGRKLRCKNHKCPSPCHIGACAPCPLTVTISCACGKTCFDVPCGTEKEQKPPKCRELCPISPLCRHGSISKPHRCHYGACPPCKLVCDELFSCGHNCKLRCHGPKPPPNPEFTLKPKKKKPDHQIECTPGSPCPPCPELVWQPCLGEHIGAERMMVCSINAKFSCNNLCGNLLACGNHYCTKTCHALKGQSSSLGQNEFGEYCEECNLRCQKDREPKCPHSCPRPCHPGECSNCTVLIKLCCHCGSMVHGIECLYYSSMSEKEQIAFRSCSGPCHRKLPYCSHPCPEICHPGQCPTPEKCSKKVTVHCGCQTLKKEWVCQDVQAAYRGAGTDPKDVPKTQYGLGLLPCDSNCKSKVMVADAELHQSKPTVVESKEPEAENHVLKRRKRRGRNKEAKPISRPQALNEEITTSSPTVASQEGLEVETQVPQMGSNSLLEDTNAPQIDESVPNPVLVSTTEQTTPLPQSESIASISGSANAQVNLNDFFEQMATFGASLPTSVVTPAVSSSSLPTDLGHAEVLNRFYNLLETSVQNLTQDQFHELVDVSNKLLSSAPQIFCMSQRVRLITFLKEISACFDDIEELQGKISASQTSVKSVTEVKSKLLKNYEACVELRLDLAKALEVEEDLKTKWQQAQHQRIDLQGQLDNITALSKDLFGQEAENLSRLLDFQQDLELQQAQMEYYMHRWEEFRSLFKK